jgi:hypothetical protein
MDASVGEKRPVLVYCIRNEKSDQVFSILDHIESEVIKLG